MAGLPKYVGAFPPAGGTVLRCKSTTLYGFPIPVTDFASLQATCAKYFDIPTGGNVTCKPLAPVVVLTVDQVLWLGSGDSEGLVENEALLQIPVAITDNVHQSTFFAAFAPIIVVDNSIALTGGREVCGYAKSMGLISGLPPLPNPSTLVAIPPAPPLPNFVTQAQPQLSVKVNGGNVNDLYWDLKPLLDVVPQPGVFAPGPFSWIAVLAMEIFLFAWSFVSAKQVFLKQFPDIANITNACFHQVTRGDYVVTALSQVVIIPRPLSLSVQHLDSHDLCAVLGINPQSTIQGYGAILDFLVENGTVVWP